MSKPSAVPGWCTSNPSGIVEPSPGQKAAGWAALDEPPAEHFNWLFNLLGQWSGYVGNMLEADGTLDGLGRSADTYGLGLAFGGSSYGRRTRFYTNAIGQLLVTYGCRWNEGASQWDPDTSADACRRLLFGPGDMVIQGHASGASFPESDWAIAANNYFRAGAAGISSLAVAAPQVVKACGIVDVHGLAYVGTPINAGTLARYTAGGLTNYRVKIPFSVSMPDANYVASVQADTSLDADNSIHVASVYLKNADYLVVEVRFIDATHTGAITDLSGLGGAYPIQFSVLHNS